MAVPYFDLSDPGFSVRSERLREAQQHSWYARTNYGIAVLRYDEVGRLLRDRRLRQGSHTWPALNGVDGPWAQWWHKIVLNLEGADHKRLRRLLTPAFSPGLISSLVPRFQALGTELIEAFVEDRRCEFVSQFAEPYASRVIAILLGLPESEWRSIAEWSSALGLALGVNLKRDLPRIEAALQGLYGYADEVIADRRRDPRDDFMTRLVQAPLSEDELRVQTVLMIFGGVDTTRSQLGLAMQTFIEHPDQWELLARRPDLGGAAVEEVMRVNPTITWVTREALEDFEFEGVEIGAGTVLHLLSSVAGTDPRSYEPPPFDITVERARHFGFGGGVHHCIGHFVARNDMSEALPLLARRLGTPQLDGELQSLPPSGNTGPLRLPVAFTPR